MSKGPDYFSEDALLKDLKGKTIRGGAYSVLAEGMQVAVQLVSIPILARLLLPEDFGLVAMATVFTTLVSALINTGLNMATLQRTKISHEQVTNLFWISAVLACVLALTLALLSIPISWFYGEPRLKLITLGLCPFYIISSLSIQQQALLQRAMRFRSMAFVRVLAVVLGQASAITIAAMTHSYWALILSPSLVALVHLVGFWQLSQWRPGLPKRGVGSKGMITFGLNLSASALANQISMHVDKIVIGRYIGAIGLGNYERSWRLLAYPLTHIAGPMTRVIIPSLSRLQHNSITYRRAYIMAVSPVIVCFAPIVGVSLSSPDWVVLTLLGNRFTDAINVYWILCFGLICFPLTSSTGWLFISQGRDREYLSVQTADAVGKTVLILVAVRWGIDGVAWACSIRLFLYALTVFTIVGRTGPVSRSVMWNRFFIMIVLSAGSYLTAVLIRALLPSDIAPWNGLLLLVLPIILSTLGMIFATPSLRMLFHELVTLVPSAFSRKASPE